ncbi:hypothetical protein DMB90_10875 [Raoultella planticola]|uniref:Uncharacterized protein n=1 Tax=Raoultella planticola TaxID=575 RepID=A0A5P6A9S8_RAOPL|nr:hypothetical protein DMB90_10875 [Raoultella planticola]
MLVATALIMFVILSLWYLSRRVLQPALSQFSALMDSAALNRKLVETAPIGLALVRGRDAELLFSNELAYSGSRAIGNGLRAFQPLMMPPVPVSSRFMTGGPFS